MIEPCLLRPTWHVAWPGIVRSNVDGLGLLAFGRQSRQQLVGLSSNDFVAASRAARRVSTRRLLRQKGIRRQAVAPARWRRSQAVASGLRASARRIAPIGSA